MHAVIRFLNNFDFGGVLMRNKKETLVGYAFLAPALIIFLALVAYPICMSIYLSFTKWNFLSGFSGIQWLGLDNFTKLFTRDRSFKTALINTFIYSVCIVPITVFLALCLAHVLNGNIYCKRYFRLAFFIPYISNMVALGAIFRFLFRIDGPINEILKKVFHFTDSEVPNWLADNTLCRVPVICVMIYSGLGYCLLIYIAAIKDISRDLYEASSIDGASPLRQFISITIPLISPTTFYLLIVRLINAFQIFTAINIIGNSGKSGGSISLVSLIYEEAFLNYNFGYASAEAWVLVVIILMVTLVQMWGQKKWVHY